MAKTNFLGSKNGFHFPNGFVNSILQVPGIGINITTKGRCGGMAFASLDYYFNSLPVPTCQSSDFGTTGTPPNTETGVPPDNTPLADYILYRLLDSFVIYGLAFVKWDGASDHQTALNGKGVIAATKEDEWPKLKNHLDNGTPVALGLITASGSFPGNLGDCHQVVAYDYALGPNLITISIYDNNFPDNDNITIQSTIDNTNPHWNESDGQIWRGFFVEDGTQPSNYGGAILQIPPPPPGGGSPPFVDIVMSSGLQASSATPPAGQPFNCSFSVKNAGPYPAHATYLNIDGSAVNVWNQVSLQEADDSIAPYFGADTMTPLNLQPGQSYTMTKGIANFNPKLGQYQLVASYYNMNSEKIDIPTNGLPNTININVVSGPSLNVSLLDQTQTIIGGIGYYVVKFSAVAQNFQPADFQWILDPGTLNEQTQTGNPVQFDVKVGSSGNYAFTHVVQVVGTDNSGTKASYSYTLQLTAPSGQIAADYADPNTKLGTSLRMNSGYILMLQDAYSAVAVDAQSQGLFAPLKYTWGQNPIQQLTNGSVAVFAMDISGPANQVSSYQGINVTLQIIDAIGQTLKLQAFVPAVVTTGGYVGPRVLNWNPRQTFVIPPPVTATPQSLTGDYIDPYAYVDPGSVARNVTNVATVVGLRSTPFIEKQGITATKLTTLGVAKRTISQVSVAAKDAKLAEASTRMR